MNATEAESDTAKPSEQLRTSQYLGYAAGDAANNLTFSMVSAFLLIYYTDVAGISAATAGTLFLVVRILGGVSDLVAGGRVDKTATRWGRFRPYLLFGGFPLMLLLIAVFSIPSGLSDGGKVAWAFVSYALFQLVYSFVNIPYGSLSAAMTQEPDERAKLATSRSIAASVTILAIALVVSPQIEGAEDLQSSLTTITIAFAVVGVGLYLWCFTTSRETVRRSREAVPLRGPVDMLRRNRPLVILCGAALVFLAGMFSLQTVAVYYARDVLGNADLYIWLTAVQTAGMLVAAAIVPKAIGAVGKKRTFVAAAFTGSFVALGVASLRVEPNVRHRRLWAARGAPGDGHHAPVGAAGRHGRLRRVEQRRAGRRGQLLGPVVHAEGRARGWRRRRGLHHRPGRLCLRR